MKAIMIIYNHAHSEKVDYMLDQLEIRGYSKWIDVQGRGTTDGAPHMGTHTWPEMNSSVLTISLSLLNLSRKLELIQTLFKP